MNKQREREQRSMEKQRKREQKKKSNVNTGESVVSAKRFETQTIASNCLCLLVTPRSMVVRVGVRHPCAVRAEKAGTKSVQVSAAVQLRRPKRTEREVLQA